MILAPLARTAAAVFVLAAAVAPSADAHTQPRSGRTVSAEQPRLRARALGLAPGVFAPGPLNAITDVAGVAVGQVTLVEGESIRTGVTAVLPHGGSLFRDKVPAGLAVANGFGKLAGATQLVELGEIETPIALTNTLAVPRAVEALIDWTLSRPGNEDVRSVNAVVGETNDGRLNDIRTRRVTARDVLAAVESARPGPVAEGSVGAGTGTVAFGWKGGIGTSSRRLPASLGGFTVGVLVQSNFGGSLQMGGAPVGVCLGQYFLQEHAAPKRARAEDPKPTPEQADGSIMIVIATDAPLSDRNLTRLARRSFAGLARTGAAFSNGSGDYAIAFSTSADVRRTPERRAGAARVRELANDAMSPLFVVVADATEEAIYNSLLMATDARSLDPVTGRTVEVRTLDIDQVRDVLAGGPGACGAPPKPARR